MILPYSSHPSACGLWFAASLHPPHRSAAGACSSGPAGHGHASPHGGPGPRPVPAFTAARCGKWCCNSENGNNMWQPKKNETKWQMTCKLHVNQLHVNHIAFYSYLCLPTNIINLFLSLSIHPSIHPLYLPWEHQQHCYVLLRAEPYLKKTVPNPPEETHPCSSTVEPFPPNIPWCLFRSIMDYSHPVVSPRNRTGHLC